MEDMPPLANTVNRIRKIYLQPIISWSKEKVNMETFLEEVNKRVDGVPIQRCYHCVNVQLAVLSPCIWNSTPIRLSR